MIRGTWAEFGSVAAVEEARRSLRGRGYHRLETYTPRPIPEAHDDGGRSWPSRLALVAFLVAVAAAAASYWVQWYTNVLDYPLNAGGRPTHAAPAFLFVSFEVVVLAAAVAVFVGFLITLRLPEPWHPAFEVEGFGSASSEGYWIAVAGDDPAGGPDEVGRLLRELGAERVVEGEVGRELEGGA